MISTCLWEESMRAVSKVGLSGQHLPVSSVTSSRQQGEGTGSGMRTTITLPLLAVCDLSYEL